MQMQQYNVENLLCNYLNRFLLECPFLKVKVEDSVVIISKGMEKCKEDGSETHQEFFECEKYDIKTNIQTLENLLKPDNDDTGISCEKISQNELLLTRKREVILDNTESIEDMFINFNDFMKYIENTKRTILLVSKKRYLVLPIAGVDPIPINRYNYVVGYVMGSIGPKYVNSSGIIKKEFIVTRQKIESLDKNSFKVYILKESEEEICYEILNQSL